MPIAMSYQVAYDLSEAGYRDWRFPAAGLLFICLGAFLVWNRRNPALRSRMSSAGSIAFPYFFLAFAVLWTSIALAATGREYLTLRRAMALGELEVTEGWVEDFTPMSYEGHRDEYFTVCGVPFSYSDYAATAGFSQSSSHFGPLRQGLWVRVSHLGNRIARIEIARQNPDTLTGCKTFRPKL